MEEFIRGIMFLSGSVIQLGSEQFSMLVLDERDWAEKVTMTNSAYL